MAIHFGISMDNHLVQPGHLDLLVLIRKLLGLADHLLDLLLCQAALVVGDGNLFLGAAQRSPVTCGMRGIFCHQKAGDWRVQLVVLNHTKSAHEQKE